MIDANAFPHIEVEGSPRQRGLQYGNELREYIGEVWNFYHAQMFQMLGCNDAHLFSSSTAFRSSS